MDSKRIFHKAQETPWNTIDNEAVVLNLDNGHYYVLNETGRRIWELLDGERTIAQVAALICEEFDTDEQKALADVSRLLEEMAAEGLVAE